VSDVKLTYQLKNAFFLFGRSLCRREEEHVGEQVRARANFFPSGKS